AGGEEPTIHDANLALGRLNGENFLGGDMALDKAAARAALKGKLADKLGLTVEEAALGMLKIAVAHMTLAVRGVSIERGYDPRDFTMVASGGNGGLHAPLIARELSIPRVILPVLPAHFSAVGMLMCRPMRAAWPRRISPRSAAFATISSTRARSCWKAKASRLISSRSSSR